MIGDYHINQRVGSTGDIDIAGSVLGGYTGAIEARFNGGAWADIGATYTGSEFTGTLAGQAQGQGTLEVRITGRPAIIGSSSYTGVGDLFGIAGQSNATGQQTAVLQAYSHASLKAGMFTKRYEWQELRDPLGKGPFRDSVSAENESFTGGTVWTKLATSIMADQGVPVGLVPCAKGGSVISAWAPGADHQDRTTLYGSMVYRCLRAGGVKAVLWWQGESDAVAGTTKATYKTAIQAIGDAVFADLGCPLIACRFLLLPEGSASLANQTAICDAISESWGTHHILAGPDLHAIAPDDNFHALSQATIDACAAPWWTAVEAALYA